MITAEVEAIGGFMGDAFALPAFQGGTLLTILIFMFMQDPIMGLAAISLYPIQMYIIPKLQRQVNALGKLRVRQVRRLSERLGETVAGVRDIRANDASQYERARFSRELGVIFDIRYKIYKKKFFIKFLNNFLAQLGPFFFFSIGGYLVIQRRSHARRAGRGDRRPREAVLAVEGAADLLPAAVGFADQVRAGGRPVRPARPARRGAAERRSRAAVRAQGRAAGQPISASSATTARRSSTASASRSTCRRGSRSSAPPAAARRS